MSIAVAWGASALPLQQQLPRPSSNVQLPHATPTAVALRRTDLAALPSLVSLWSEGLLERGHLVWVLCMWALNPCAAYLPCPCSLLGEVLHAHC